MCKLIPLCLRLGSSLKLFKLYKMDFPLFLHIGYHKTATTLLQNNVFSRHPEIFYLGRSWESCDLAQFFNEYKYIHDLEFNPTKLANEFRRIQQDYYEESKAKVSEFCKKKICVISHESLHSGPDWFGIDIEGRARRMSQVFPNSKNTNRY